MTWKGCTERFCMFTIFVSAVASSACSDTITVDDDGFADHEDIQSAIFASQDGDTILILPGNYSSMFSQNIFDTNGKKIHIRSSDGPGVTFIDGRNQYRCIECNSGENSETIIEGLTIMNGLAPFGAGIYLSNSSPTIRNCVFRSNVADFYGGSILCQTAHPRIEDCTFTENSAGAWGAALYSMYDSIPQIHGCVFTNNASIENGGAIAGGSGSHTIIANSLFSSNGSGTGGAIYNNQSDCTIHECIFIDNTSLERGGAVSAKDGCSMKITSSAFQGNLSTEGGTFSVNSSDIEIVLCELTNNIGTARGGCLDATNDSTVLVEDTSIRLHSSTIGGAIFGDNSMLQITGCTVTENSANSGGAIYTLMGQTYITESLICNNSPDQIVGKWQEDVRSCIARWCETDEDGVTGCLCPADIDRNGFVDGADLTILLSSWGWCGAGYCPEDLSNDGLIDGLDLGIFLGFWGPCE